MPMLRRNKPKGKYELKETKGQATSLIKTLSTNTGMQGSSEISVLQH